MKKLDKESKAFIKWALTQLDDEYAYSVIGKKWGLSGWLGSDVLKKAKKKMIAGAREHGPVKESLKEIDKEIWAEVLDLILWGLMKVWRKNNPK